MQIYAAATHFTAGKSWAGEPGTDMPCILPCLLVWSFCGPQHAWPGLQNAQLTVPDRGSNAWLDSQ